MFAKAERKKSKLRLGLSGIEGSGKTWSALEIATGMGGRISFIDTEAGKGEMYSEDFDYDVIQIGAPYTTEKYINAIKLAEKMGYENLIIDSLSHAWNGEGGILSIIDQSGSKTFTEGWRFASPKHYALINAIITSKMHVIVTTRSKADTVLEMNSKGKMVPIKIGMKPIQREDLGYEMTVFMEIGEDNIAHVKKDNTKLFYNQYIKPTKEMGRQFVEWLNSGVDAEQVFIETTLPKIIKELESIKDLEELKNTYIEYYTKYNKLYPTQIDKLTIAQRRIRGEIECQSNDLLSNFSEEKEVS